VIKAITIGTLTIRVDISDARKVIFVNCNIHNYLQRNKYCHFIKTALHCAILSTQKQIATV